MSRGQFCVSIWQYRHELFCCLYVCDTYVTHSTPKKCKCPFNPAGVRVPSVCTVYAVCTSRVCAAISRPAYTHEGAFFVVLLWGLVRRIAYIKAGVSFRDMYSKGARDGRYFLLLQKAHYSAVRCLKFYEERSKGSLAYRCTWTRDKQLSAHQPAFTVITSNKSKKGTSKNQLKLPQLAVSNAGTHCTFSFLDRLSLSCFRKHFCWSPTSLKYP